MVNDHATTTEDSRFKGGVYAGLKQAVRENMAKMQAEQAQKIMEIADGLDAVKSSEPFKKFRAEMENVKATMTADLLNMDYSQPAAPTKAAELTGVIKGITLTFNYLDKLIELHNKTNMI